jgi:AcrR family transcriptional regulator
LSSVPGAFAGDPHRPARRSRRADAQLDYDRLVAVARAATQERGERISLEDIAREAGVAIGTLYNHFPTRQDLLAATFIDETEELRTRAVELIDHVAPAEALRAWLHLHLQYSARGRGLGALVMSWKYVEGSDMQVAFQAMREAGEHLFGRAVDHGDVRGGVQLIDLLRLIWGLELISAQAAAPLNASTRCSIS